MILSILLTNFIKYLLSSRVDVVTIAQMISFYKPYTILANLYPRTKSAM